MLRSFLGKFKKTKKTKIPYNSKLISKFHSDHKKIIKIIQKIIDAIEKNDDKTIHASLKSLKMSLLGHFMEEDTMLYQYLKEYYKDNPSTYELIIEFYSSIKEIQRTLLKFLDKYLAKTKYDIYFEKEFELIVQGLSSRVESEESSLYTLYLK